jgi:hypothetical protein
LYRKADDVLICLKDFPFAGACIEVYHQFFKLLPNGVKFDSEFENMYCIRGLLRDNDGNKPQVVEFGPELAETIQRGVDECTTTPMLINFMKVGAKKMETRDLKVPDDVIKAS